MSSQRPNILFVFSDQQHYASFDPATNEDLHVPAIRKLAAEGTRFPNAYATNPICGPARSSFFTGRMPSELGTSYNGTDFQVPVELVSERLANAGYRSYYAGKWHVGHCMVYDLPGFDVLCTGSNCDGNFSDPAITMTVEGFLRNHDTTEPFFLTVSYQQPHDICGWKNFQHSSAEDMPYPWLNDELPAAPANLSEFDNDEPESIQRFRANIPPGRHQWDEQAWRYYRWAYHRQIEMVDAELGRLLQVLEETGLRDNTVVIYTTDHGENAGHHALTDKSVPYDEAACTPVIVSWPGGLPEGVVDESLVSGLDIFPTVCSLAGAEIPSALRGKSLLAEDLAQREFVCTETSHIAVSRVIRSRRHKYIRFEEDGHEQLFDLIEDPLEQHNLARDEANSSILEQHRAWLREWEAGLAHSAAPRDRTAARTDGLGKRRADKQ